MLSGSLAEAQFHADFTPKAWWLVAGKHHAFGLSTGACFLARESRKHGTPLRELKLLIPFVMRGRLHSGAPQPQAMPMEPNRVLKSLEASGWPREKFLAFACWCVRHTPLADGRKVWDLLADHRSQNAIETAERWLERKAELDEVQFAYEEAACVAGAGGYKAADAAAEAAFVCSAINPGLAASRVALGCARAAGHAAAPDLPQHLARPTFSRAYAAARNCQAAHVLQEDKTFDLSQFVHEMTLPVQILSQSGTPSQIWLRGINCGITGHVWHCRSLVRVGRLPGSEMVLDNYSVSRRHAEIRFTHQGWQVRDLGSRNGTYLNGVRLTAGEWAVKAGDVLRFGKVFVTIYFKSRDADSSADTIAG